jgi:hypothetical protein
MRDSPRRVFLDSTTQDRTWDDLFRLVAALILDRASGTFRSACLISLIVRIVRIHYVWLTMMRLVAVLVRFREVALEHLAVSETGAIVLRGFLMQPHLKPKLPDMLIAVDFRDRSSLKAIWDDLYVQ